MKIAELPQPDHEIVVKVLMAKRPDIDRFAQPKIIHRHRGPPRVKIFGIRREYLTFLRLDDITPQTRRVKMAGWECPFERKVVFFSRRQLIEFDYLQPKQ